MPNVWPLVPHPEIGEALAWNTDVRRDQSSEMRDSLSDAVQSLSYRFPRSGDYQLAEGLLRSNPLGEWLVPVWHEASKAGDVLATDTVLNVDMNASYGAQALVFGDKDNWQVVDIASVGASLMLTGAIGTAYTNPTVAPLRTCYAIGGAAAEKTSYRHGGLEVTFQAKDDFTPSGSAYPVYDSLPYVKCAGFAIQPLSGSIVQPAEMISSGFGAFVPVALRSVVEGRYSVEMAFGNRADLMEFYRFLGDVRGRDMPFWVPAWGGALELSSSLSAGATSALVTPIYDDVASYVGKHALIGSDVRQITSANVSFDKHNITFSALSAPATEARMVLKVRLDTDRVEFAHRRGLASNASFMVIEVPA